MARQFAPSAVPPYLEGACLHEVPAGEVTPAMRTTSYIPNYRHNRSGPLLHIRAAQIKPAASLTQSLAAGLRAGRSALGPFVAQKPGSGRCRRGERMARSWNVNYLAFQVAMVAGHGQNFQRVNGLGVSASRQQDDYAGHSLGSCHGFTLFEKLADLRDDESHTPGEIRPPQ